MSPRAKRGRSESGSLEVVWARPGTPDTHTHKTVTPSDTCSFRNMASDLLGWNARTIEARLAHLGRDEPRDDPRARGDSLAGLDWGLSGGWWRTRGEAGSLCLHGG